MRLPTPLTLLCAAMVVLWGAYRIRIGLRSDEAERRAREKKGLFALPRRTHLLVGVVYVLLGAGLAAVALGWDPLRRDEAPAAPAPARAADPGGVPVEAR